MRWKTCSIKRNPRYHVAAVLFVISAAGFVNNVFNIGAQVYILCRWDGFCNSSLFLLCIPIPKKSLIFTVNETLLERMDVSIHKFTIPDSCSDRNTLSSFDNSAGGLRLGIENKLA